MLFWIGLVLDSCFTFYRLLGFYYSGFLFNSQAMKMDSNKSCPILVKHHHLPILQTDQKVLYLGLERGLSGWELLLTLQRTSIGFPASTWCPQPSVTPVLDDPMCSSGLCRHCSLVVHRDTSRQNTQIHFFKEAYVVFIQAWSGNINLLCFKYFVFIIWFLISSWNCLILQLRWSLGRNRHMKHFGFFW